MEYFWYVVLVLMLAAYVVLDGYDFGAGIIHLFFGKTEQDKKAITNAIGPFWDANEVWLIATGGVLFFAFPIQLRFDTVLLANFLKIAFPEVSVVRING